MAINIEVCYATSEKQHLEPLSLPKGATLRDAVAQALPSLKRVFPELIIDLESNASHFGIFSQPKDAGYLLQDNDRVEIYRPLLIDPMKKKQERQAQQGLKKIAR
jgi:putative ubiquitin-RnfH superfamily antitoxin RatB of RatAB toxin-antitoxin module